MLPLWTKLIFEVFLARVFQIFEIGYKLLCGCKMFLGKLKEVARAKLPPFYIGATTICHFMYAQSMAFLQFIEVSIT